MFENYKATKKDFKAIEEGIKAVWRKEMDFIFKDKSLIENVVVISHDSKFLYLWTKLKLSRLETIPCQIKEYHAYKIPHKAKIADEMQMGWQANAYYFNQCLARVLLSKACISGSLLTPFIKIHQKYIKDKNIERRHWAKAYSTYESYLATIVHEFGHIYYNSFPFSSKAKRLNKNYLKTALSLYMGKKTKKLPEIRFHQGFLFNLLTELFAFACDYYVTSLFWSDHKKDLDRYHKTTLQKMIKYPALLSSKNPHFLAVTLGKIILFQYPETWPQILTQPKVFNFALTQPYS